MESDGAAGERSSRWIGRYGGVVVAEWDIPTADGRKEGDLVVHLLRKAEATYPEDDGLTPPIPLSVFSKYPPDHCAPVA